MRRNRQKYQASIRIINPKIYIDIRRTARVFQRKEAQHSRLWQSIFDDFSPFTLVDVEKEAPPIEMVDITCLCGRIWSKVEMHSPRQMDAHTNGIRHIPKLPLDCVLMPRNAPNWCKFILRTYSFPIKKPASAGLSMGGLNGSNSKLGSVFILNPLGGFATARPRLARCWIAVLGSHLGSGR